MPMYNPMQRADDPCPPIMVWHKRANALQEELQDLAVDLEYYLYPMPGGYGVEYGMEMSKRARGLVEDHMLYAAKRVRGSPVEPPAVVPLQWCPAYDLACVLIHQYNDLTHRYAEFALSRGESDQEDEDDDSEGDMAMSDVQGEEEAHPPPARAGIDEPVPGVAFSLWEHSLTGARAGVPQNEGAGDSSDKERGSTPRGMEAAPRTPADPGLDTLTRGDFVDAVRNALRSADQQSRIVPGISQPDPVIAPRPRHKLDRAGLTLTTLRNDMWSLMLGGPPSSDYSRAPQALYWYEEAARLQAALHECFKLCMLFSTKEREIGPSQSILDGEYQKAGPLMYEIAEETRVHYSAPSFVPVEWAPAWNLYCVLVQQFSALCLLSESDAWTDPQAWTVKPPRASESQAPPPCERPEPLPCTPAEDLEDLDDLKNPGPRRVFLLDTEDPARFAARNIHARERMAQLADFSRAHLLPIVPDEPSSPGVSWQDCIYKENFPFYLRGLREVLLTRIALEGRDSEFHDAAYQKPVPQGMRN